MGVTINYRGKLNDPALMPSICEELRDISEDMNWHYRIFDEDLDKPDSSYIDKGGVIKGHVPLKGIIIFPHPKSGSLSFLFDKEGNLRNLVMMAWMSDEELRASYDHVKTQFAPIDIHVTIVKLLKYIKKKYISNLEVLDEGQYWETENKELLKEKIDFINQKIDEVGNLITGIEISEHDDEESIVDKIEKVLRKLYKK